MKRDMDLMRKILFAIEDKYKPGDRVIFCLSVEEYDLQTVAEHCDLLYQKRLVTKYEPTWGGNTLVNFSVGNLSDAGYDYLELIRNDEVWEKTTDEVNKKQLPNTIEWIARIAGVFTGNVVKELNS